MKFVKRISLFFIYPMTMFAFGFASNMAIMEFFYPGDSGVKMQTQEAAKLPEETVAVSVSDEPVITANTQYIIQAYNTVTGETIEEDAVVPDKFIGLDREKLVQEINEYNKTPSLSDLELGFYHMELVSFASGRVVVRKSYELEEENGFFLLNENHYVVVYDQRLSQVYMNTDILVEELPENIQNEILNMKYIEDEGELYNFLESYSS